MLNSAYLCSTELVSTFKLLAFGTGAAYLAANRQWACDIGNFNLAGGIPPAKLTYLQVGKLPPFLHSKFEELKRQTGWNSPIEVCQNLNIPQKNKYLYSPWDHKYIYEYDKKFKTRNSGQALEDCDILRPLDAGEVAAFENFY